MNPRARSDGLLVRRLAAEVLIYDLDRHEAHCLNPSAALVFEHCDGRTSVGEMARSLHAELALPADENLVWLALQRLETARLLEQCPLPPPELGRWSRREAVRRVGLGLAILLPGVQSILAPLPAEAATCRTPVACQSGSFNGQQCSDDPASFPCTGWCFCNSTCGSLTCCSSAFPGNECSAGS